MHYQYIKYCQEREGRSVIQRACEGVSRNVKGSMRTAQGTVPFREAKETMGVSIPQQVLSMKRGLLSWYRHEKGGCFSSALKRIRASGQNISKVAILLVIGEPTPFSGAL